jgi:uncharacterized protein (TIGR03118 family)
MPRKSLLESKPQHSPGSAIAQCRGGSLTAGRWLDACTNALDSARQNSKEVHVTIRNPKLTMSLAILGIALTGWLHAEDANNYHVTILVSNEAGGAPVVDPKLVNAWGIAANATSPWWVSNNGTNSATLYNGAGVKQALEVTVVEAPTGIVAYPTTGTQFHLSSGLSARFIWAAESGSLAAWRSGPTAEVVFSNPSAIYKGLARVGDTLYATNFAACAVETFDGSFHPFDHGGFEDSSIPDGFCPFGIQAFGSSVFVTYALRAGFDDEAGVGHGFVREFSAEGHLLARVATHGTLNSPWGMAMAPDGFGKFGGCLLVGNFGDGLINAYCEVHPGMFNPAGRLQERGHDLRIDGLWGIGFGNGAASGPMNVLYFAAGPDGEANGHFGKIEATPPQNGHLR